MSPAEALDMGRYAGYVWGSYGVMFLFLAVEIVMLRQRRRTIFKRLGRILQMRKREQANEAKT